MCVLVPVRRVAMKRQDTCAHADQHTKCRLTNALVSLNVVKEKKIEMVFALVNNSLLLSSFFKFHFVCCVVAVQVRSCSATPTINCFGPTATCFLSNNVEKCKCESSTTYELVMHNATHNECRGLLLIACVSLFKR